MDHFTHNIIRESPLTSSSAIPYSVCTVGNELRALTGTPAPNPTHWAFSPENDLVFAVGRLQEEERVTPTEWLSRGYPSIQVALANGSGA